MIFARATTLREEVPGIYTLLRKLSLLICTASLLCSAAETKRPNVGVDQNDKALTHIAFGGGWSTTITLVSLYGVPSPFTLRFYSDNGGVLNAPVAGKGSVPSITDTIPAGGSRTYEISTSDPNSQAGWAELSYDWSATVVGGMAIFKYSNGSEAVVPMSSNSSSTSTLAFDYTGGNKTGIAIANPASEPASMTIKFYNQEGDPIGDPVSLTLTDKGHKSIMLHDLQPLVQNQRGTMVLQANTGHVTVLGIRANPLGGFTSIHSLDDWDPTKK